MWARVTLESLAWSVVALAVAAVTMPLHADTPLLPGSEQQILQGWKDAWRQKSSGQPEYLNRLALSESAYLRQHADNPIDWHPWVEAAFARAVEENKLVFLSIGYASCHWCHVMEAESFSDPEVARVLNRSFISIKVDREQQPDIDAWFSMVVETIKGESGWPVTLVLLPNREPVFAANYLKKSELLTAMGRLGQFWSTQPEVLRQNAELFSGEIERRNQKRVQSNNRPEIPWTDQARTNLLAGVDAAHGGFGSGNKFPDELKLQFLLNAYKSNQSDELRQVLKRQLDAVMNSGLSDVVFGGLFRYTTDREMTRPHFEKMLYNQALSVRLFADAATWLENPVYKSYAGSIIRFVEQYMRLPGGGYAAAIDADYQGREGGYYLWPEEVLDDVPAAIRRVPFGNSQYYLYGAYSEPQPDPWQAALPRSGKTTPNRIDNRVTAWNALWISALLTAGDTDTASQLADSIWESSWSRNQLFRLGSQPGFLDDYSYLSEALWQLYLKTGDSGWKDRARILDNRILDLFYRDGGITYNSRNQRSHYTTDLHQDRELHSPLAATLNVFANHQTELEFVEAYENLRAGANAVIGNRPELYLSVIQMDFADIAKSEHIIAKGHGMVSLHDTNTPGEWMLRFKLDTDWHINASEVFDSSLMATRVTAIQTQGVEQSLQIDYPQGTEIDTEFSDVPLNVYGGQVKIGITSASDPERLWVRVRVQACSNRVCLLPEEVQLTLH